MSSDDANYYRRRAQAERERAKASSNANLAEIQDGLRAFMKL
jgi:hypothetical protein